MSDVVGSAEFELRATRDKLKADLAAAERDLKQFGDRAENNLNDSAGGISNSVKGVGAVVTALVSVLGVALTAALAFGRASLQMAADISDSAGRIGVSTNALQEWEFVVRRSGGEAHEAGAAIDAFGKKFASAAAGLSRSDLNAFKALGFDQEQLRAFKDTESALDAVVDRIGDLKNESDRAAAAEKVGLGALSTALREGADSVADLRDEASALGYVMDESLIRKGAEAQEKLDDLSKVIGVQMAEAFVQLSDEILSFTAALAGAIGKLNDLLGAYNRWKDRARVTGDLPDERERQLATLGPLGSFAALARNRARAGIRIVTGEQQRRERALDTPGDVDDPALLRQRMATDQIGVRPPRESSGRTELTPVQPRGRQPREDRTAEREARRAERVEQDIFRARQRLLNVSEGDLLTAQERWDLAVDQLKMDRESRDAELESKNARGEIKDAELARLQLAHEEADIVEDRILTDTSLREIRDEELANARVLADLTATLVSLQIGAARTASERQRLELQLLEIVQKQRRDALDRQLNNTPGLSDAERQQAWDKNKQIEDAERGAVGRANMSPLEQWRDQSLKSAEEVAEAYESIAARGLDSLNDGLVDAIMNSRSLGDVFKNVANQIIADLLRISVRRGIVEPLANAVFGGAEGSKGGGAGAGWMAQLLKFIPGFSSGVTNFSGGLAYVHQGEVLANLAPGTDVIPAHAVGKGGSRGGTPVSFDLRGAVLTADLLRQMEGMAAGAQGSAVQGARNVVPADMARTSRYSFNR